MPAQDPKRGWVLKVVSGQPPRVRTVPVSITLRSAEGVAIEGKLAAGDRLVTAHETTLLRLHDGDPVRVEVNGR